MVHPSEELKPEDWQRALETDLFGVFYGCQSAVRQMITQGTGGSIINLTSAYGLVASPMRAAYCTSKAGANMLTKLLACEWASKNIRVNAIAPVHKHGIGSGPHRQGRAPGRGHRKKNTPRTHRRGLGPPGVGGTARW